MSALRTMMVMSCLALVAPLEAKAAPQGEAKAVQQPVKTLIQAIRYGKDDLGVRALAGDPQGQFLLGTEWAKITPAQREEFVNLFHELLAGIAFPRVREDFEKLDTILYDEPNAKGKAAEVGSTIVILHPLKKREIKATYQLVHEEKAKGWKVLDVAIIGDKSMLTNIRDDQIVPILRDGGVDLLLRTMRERLREVRSQSTPR